MSELVKAEAPAALEKREITPELIQNFMDELSLYDQERFRHLPLEQKEDAVREALRRSDVMRSRISPKGTMGLPPLLDERRHEYGIVDGAFAHQAVMDAVLVRPISQFRGTTYGDTIIHMTEGRQAAEEWECGRAVVVSAGLKAMDELASNGIGLGHIVNVGKHTPLRIRVDVVNGEPYHLLMLRPGDIVTSEDLAQGLHAGAVKLNAELDEHGAPLHTYSYRKKDGEYSQPVKYLVPWQPDDT
jgi:hypothetical protein